MKTHFIGLKSLIDAAGGLQHFHPTLCAAIMVLSCIASVKLDIPPPTPPPIPTSLTLSQSTRHTLHHGPSPTLNKLGTSFLQPQNLPLLGSELLSTILSRRTASLLQILCNTGYLDLSASDFHYFCLQVRSTEYQLVTMPSSVPLTPLQEAIRLALLSFSFASTAPPKRLTSAYACCFASELGTALMDSLRSGCWGASGDYTNDLLLVWTLFTAVHASPGRKERTWLVIQLSKCLARGGYMDMESVREVLEGYFYLECVNGRTLKQVWDEYEMLSSSGALG